MSTRATTTRSGTAGSRYDRHPAELYDRVVGPVLIIVGILGFIASSSFSTGGNPPGSDFIIFQVNGWHNIIHIASGLLLCLGIGNWARARTITLLFGMTYGLVAIWGWIDGNDVFHLIPVDTADNILHTVLALAAIAVGLAPAPDDHALADTPGRARTGDMRSSATSPAGMEAEDRFTRGGDRVTGERTAAERTERR